MTEREKMIEIVLDTEITGIKLRNITGGISTANAIADALIEAGFGDVTEWKERAEKAERRAEVAMRALLDCMKDSRPAHCSIAICSKWTRCGDDTCVETRRAIFIEQAEREIEAEKGE